MNTNVHHKFSSHLCSKCGGPAPGWKCPACNLVSPTFDQFHFQKCRERAKMESQCQRCGEAESNCAC